MESTRVNGAWWLAAAAEQLSQSVDVRIPKAIRAEYELVHQEVAQHASIAVTAASKQQASSQQPAQREERTHTGANPARCR